MLGTRTQEVTESYNYTRAMKLVAIGSTRVRLNELRTQAGADSKRIADLDAELERLDAKEKRAMAIPEAWETSIYGTS
jgi:hypothetical protein